MKYIALIFCIVTMLGGCRFSDETLEKKVEEIKTTTTVKPEKFDEITEITQKFNHEACQYPQRWSNPENGCDNSDLANPECIDEVYSKEAEQECVERHMR